mmetsp:Transcript_8401/g.25916  ORF Transcript_8401/g.25916 Transcript_8401/m.25916 type:complete len:400 (-) Transcript_8401:190-1389(-)
MENAGSALLTTTVAEVWETEQGDDDEQARRCAEKAASRGRRRERLALAVGLTVGVGLAVGTFFGSWAALYYKWNEQTSFSSRQFHYHGHATMWLRHSTKLGGDLTRYGGAGFAGDDRVGVRRLRAVNSIAGLLGGVCCATCATYYYVSAVCLRGVGRLRRVTETALAFILLASSVVAWSGFAAWCAFVSSKRRLDKFVVSAITEETYFYYAYSVNGVQVHGGQTNACAAGCVLQACSGVIQLALGLAMLGVATRGWLWFALEVPSDAYSMSCGACGLKTLLLGSPASRSGFCFVCGLRIPCFQCTSNDPRQRPVASSSAAEAPTFFSCVVCGPCGAKSLVVGYAGSYSLSCGICGCTVTCCNCTCAYEVPHAELQRRQSSSPPATETEVTVVTEPQPAE